MNARSLSAVLAPWLLAGIGLFAGCAGQEVAPRHDATADQRDRTQRALSKFAYRAREVARYNIDSRRSGHTALSRLCGLKLGTSDSTVSVCEPEHRDAARDEWGSVIRFRAPGPIHDWGWDVWSCGPNGVDEAGRGDDIIIGENLEQLVSPEEITRQTLRALGERTGETRVAIHANGSVAEPTGLREPADGLWAQGVRGAHRVVIEGSFSRLPGTEPGDQWIGSNEFLNGDDGWRRPVRYRCPGPVHANGWDLYSFGPNGIDDGGRGDDILIGDDIGGVIRKE